MKPRTKLLTLISLPLILILVACSNNSQKSPPEGAPGGPTNGSVTLKISPDGKEFDTYDISCSNEMAFCEDLVENKALGPTPADLGCTMQYGGPQKAMINGQIADRTVALDFSRSNGCEITRWSSLIDSLQKLKSTPISLPSATEGINDYPG